MGQQVAAQVGSGTIPFVRGILPASQRGNQAAGEGLRTGMQVVIANPEDFNSVDAFAVSGVSIGATPVQIWGPGINPLPRQRSVIVQNAGPGNLFIGPDSTSVIAPSGMQIRITAGFEHFLTLPFLHNVQIWARSDTTTQVQILAY